MSPRTTPAAGLLLALTLALAGAAAPTLAAEPNDFSRAENLVFVDRHLGNVKLPSVLRYEFVKSGALEAGFSDQVRLDVGATPGKACCLVKGSFFSGERTVKMPDFEDAPSNPVIMFFLEHDISEMARLTARKDGTYFRRKISRALFEDATLRDITVPYDGRSVAAKEVTVTPYAKDPAKARYERYANKTYVFVLAPSVPGGVFQIRSSMAGTQAGDPAVMIEEVLNFAGVDAAPAPSAKR